MIEKIACSVTTIDISYINNIGENRKIKEHIDKIANNFITHRDNFLNFKNCIECFFLRSCSRFRYVNNLSEMRKEFILNSTIEIIKNGFNLDKLKLYFSEDMICTKLYQIYKYEFCGWHIRSFYHTKECLYENEIIEKFYRICIEETKPIIERYILTQSYNKEGMNNCLEEIVK
ncbi:hypothetical protein H311_04567, partial [Anncaliia algerae PRA109]